LNQAYPLSLDQQLTFTLPEKAQIISLPAMRENSTPPLRWKVEWQQPSPGKLAARFTAELERGELSPSDTRLFQEQLAALQDVLPAPVMTGAGNPSQRR
jgi:hypothetical protein